MLKFITDREARIMRPPEIGEAYERGLKAANKWSFEHLPILIKSGLDGPTASISVSVLVDPYYKRKLTNKLVLNHEGRYGEEESSGLTVFNPNPQLHYFGYVGTLNDVPNGMYAFLARFSSDCFFMVTPFTVIDATLSGSAFVLTSATNVHASQMIPKLEVRSSGHLFFDTAEVTVTISSEETPANLILAYKRPMVSGGEEHAAPTYNFVLAEELRPEGLRA